MRRKNRGFSLLEALVALAILALLVVSALEGLSHALAGEGMAYCQSKGTLLAKAAADRIRAGAEDAHKFTQEGFTFVPEELSRDGKTFLVIEVKLGGRKCSAVAVTLK